MSGAPILITGGAGFIGSNLANRLLEARQRVRVLDNLSRPGVEQNLQWLRRSHGSLLEIVVGDVRDASALMHAVEGVTQVFHFAAQVAVTTSLERPQEDFAVNALGTLHLLEAVRARAPSASVLLTSTNKVYGALADVALTAQGQRYLPVDEPMRARGLSESRPLDFYSPYGCSKGAADQYVRDYARSFGLATVVFRMSCIYGPRQFGTEDQGWVAHFVLRALRGEPITIFGDGRQVRDILFIDDLVAALLLAQRQARQLAGRAFNIGGGPGSSISLLELLDEIERLHGRRPPVNLADWRIGDQRYYVSDTGAFEQATGWHRRVGAREGIAQLNAWLSDFADAGPASRRQAAAAAQ